MSDVRRRIPRTDALLADPRLAAARERLGRTAVKDAIVAAQGRARAGDIAPDGVAAAAAAALPASPTTLRPIINATGVLVHTNLGRAPLSDAAREALALAAGATDVEFDLGRGTRGRRGRGALDALRAQVPEAGDVHLVNNNAAALALVATTFAAGREIVISRGELVEIGDGFRIPDLLTSTGARLREVGTTNRTIANDYAQALSAETGMVLKVHPSNFVVRGFTADVSVAELAQLATPGGVPVVVDIGSGLLGPEPLLPTEPDASTALRDGADLVTASGDKLLGGPQAGLVLGRADLVERVRRHPLARALRVDKLTLAALEATLRGPIPPVRAALTTDIDGLRSRARELAHRLSRSGVDARAVDCSAMVGGGGAPGVQLPSAGVSLPASYAAQLRQGDPAVVARIERDRCLLDLRTVPAAHDAQLLAAVDTIGRTFGAGD